MKCICNILRECLLLCYWKEQRGMGGGGMLLDEGYCVVKLMLGSAVNVSNCAVRLGFRFVLEWPKSYTQL